MPYRRAGFDFFRHAFDLNVCLGHSPEIAWRLGTHSSHTSIELAGLRQSRVQRSRAARPLAASGRPFAAEHEILDGTLA
jgi:hypothetical protein